MKTCKNCEYYTDETRTPTVYAMKRIARALGCTIDDLVVGLEDEN